MDRCVIVGVIFILILFELSLRLVEHRLSGNVANIQQFPLIAEQVKTTTKKNSVVFLGNSLTANAVGPRVVEKSINAISDAEAAVFAITPDGTSISDWYCLYRNLLADQANSPNYIYVGFAWNLLTDQLPVNAARLGGHFCEFSDLDGLASTQLAHHDQVLEFAAGYLSHIYVSREAIRNRILAMFVPEYETITQKLNVNVAAEPGRNDGLSTPETYHTLSSLIKMMQARGTQVVLMAMPVVAPYKVDPNLIELLGELGAGYVDLREAPGIQRNMFLDNMHLDSEGRRVFSTLIGRDIALRIQQPSGIGSEEE